MKIPTDKFDADTPERKVPLSTRVRALVTGEAVDKTRGLADARAAIAHALSLGVSPQALQLALNDALTEHHIAEVESQNGGVARAIAQRKVAVDTISDIANMKNKDRMDWELLPVYTAEAIEENEMFHGGKSHGLIIFKGFDGSLCLSRFEYGETINGKTLKPKSEISDPNTETDIVTVLHDANKVLHANNSPHSCMRSLYYIARDRINLKRQNAQQSTRSEIARRVGL